LMWAVAQSHPAMAKLLLEGKGIRRDVPRAIELLDTAARQGLPLAQFELSRLYFEGVTGTPQPELAYAWMTVCAASGDQAALRVQTKMRSHLTREQLGRAEDLAIALMEQIPDAASRGPDPTR